MHPVSRRLWLVVALLLVCSACSSLGTPAVQRPVAPVEKPAASPSGQPVPSLPPSGPVSCVRRVFSSMTEAQRVGQLFAVGLAGDQLGPATVSAIRTYHFGSVHFIVTSDAGVSGTRAVTSAVQSLASRGVTAGVRFFVAANQEGGE